jgi:hypothetical protein
MNVWRRIGVIFLIASFLMPDVGLTMQTWRTQDPCGMIICCCPHMCKMAKKHTFNCHRNSRESCGIKTGSTSPFSYSNDSLIAQVGIAAGDLMPAPSPEFRASFEERLRVPSDQSARLEKPPAFLS